MPTEISWRMKITDAVFANRGWSTLTPVKDLPKEALDFLLYAPKDEKVVVKYKHERGENSYVATFEGVITNLERRYKETESEYIRTELEKFMIQKPCPSCHGRRLRPEILAVTVNGRNVADVSGMSVTDALDWATGLAATVTEREATIARQVIKEIVARLGFLVDVGLDYLTLDRASRSACRAVRHSGSGWPPRSAPRSWASSTSSTSRRSASTSATTPSSSPRSPACGTSATPCSSWSTTRRPSARPTG